MRDGLILDLGGFEATTAALRHQVVSSTLALGRKFGFDEGHARVVASLAVQLFDALQPEHGLGATERLYLEVAALLHDIGLYIANRAHHKHSLYLISASEIFGIGGTQLRVVANVARYHRRAMPQKRHPEYMALPRRERSLVNKLAAILRLADSLDREHGSRNKVVKVERTEDGIVIWVPRRGGDMEAELAAFETKKDLFEEVYGREVTLNFA